MVGYCRQVSGSHRLLGDAAYGRNDTLQHNLGLRFYQTGSQRSKTAVKVKVKTDQRPATSRPTYHRSDRSRIYAMIGLTDFRARLGEVKATERSKSQVKAEKSSEGSESRAKVAQKVAQKVETRRPLVGGQRSYLATLLSTMG